MFSLLLAIIYLAFISLGLPDSLLGSAWPVMHEDLGVAIAYAGIPAMIIAGGTIVSSLLSDRVTKKFGAGTVTAVSVLMTALGLFGFSLSKSFIVICLWAFPYGLGAGAVDAALNNYVALHYASRHMSWLHCFWGIGASVSPYIMGWSLSHGFGWSGGYRTVGIIQIVLTAFLFLSLPLWKKTKEERSKQTHSLFEVIKIRGVPLVLICFFAYCALESTAGLWASSYLVKGRGVDSETAAGFASLFYLGITSGRFLNGFVADRIASRNLIRIGLSVIVLGIALIFLPVKFLALSGLVVAGFGCAPIYPSIIHATPANFGSNYSQAIIGIQMAGAYVGSTFMPPLFGFIAGKIGIVFYPFYLLVFALLMILTSETLNRKLAQKKQEIEKIQAA
ncbi:MAG TPA: MFS transporter [Bacilli bacterium]